jgi:hypothetical protein
VFYETIRKAATDAAVNETNQRWDDPPLDEDEDGKNRPAEPLPEFGYDDHPWMSHLRWLEFWVSETFWRLVTPKGSDAVCMRNRRNRIDYLVSRLVRDIFS